jgi:tRNA threonylcarbamoyl adenosine modification protein (Sua5/YciO/YrdC/YwlC family)
MTQFLHIHPVNPQLRLIRQAVEVLRKGGVIVYPTDSGYALGCLVGEKEAAERIREIRQLDKQRNFTLVCRDLSELATYANVDNTIFKLLKAYTPGPYTFILLATKEVPKRLQHAKQKTIGLRIPDNLIAQKLLQELGEPLMSVTLFSPGEEVSIPDSDEIYARFNKQVDLIIDGGFCGDQPTTVVDFVLSGDNNPQIVRVGKGDPAPFLPITRS